MTTRDFLQTDLSVIYNEVADFFASSPSAEQITQFRLSESSDQIISDLLEANRTRGLTPDERTALDEYTRIERLMQAIKVRAFAKLKQAAS
jgi:hypothetical protein